MLCCGYTLTDFPISIRLTALALWQSYDCPSASEATLMIMDKYFMWIHYEPLHNHNKAKHNKTVCIFLGIYCKLIQVVALLGSFMTIVLKIHLRQAESWQFHLLCKYEFIYVTSFQNEFVQKYIQIYCIFMMILRNLCLETYVIYSQKIRQQICLGLAEDSFMDANMISILMWHTIAITSVMK